jgi:molecular chaperone Hsp33
MTDPDRHDHAAADDIVAAFQIQDQPVRGRIVRLGPATVDVILRRHAYPDPVARLLGEALTLVSLIGASLKFEGKLILQVQGDGPVSFLVAEYRTNGSLRGYAHAEGDAVALVAPGAEAQVFLGQGTLALTIDQGEHTERYQGIVPLEGRTLAECAELYFAQSEQVPTRLRLAVAEVDGPTGRPEWRAGGVLLQQVAGDQGRRVGGPGAFRRGAAVSAVPRTGRSAGRTQAPGSRVFMHPRPDCRHSHAVWRRRDRRSGRGWGDQRALRILQHQLCV